MGDHPIRATRSEPETGRCRGPDEAARRAADIVGRLSDASRWLQFLGTKKELSPAELRYLTEVDHHDHEALAALDQASGRTVGVAR